MRGHASDQRHHTPGRRDQRPSTDATGAAGALATAASWRAPRRVLRATCLAIAACLLAAAPSAWAGQDTIWNGVMPSGGKYGPRHTLSSAWTTWSTGGDACITSVNSPSGSWNTGICTTTSDVNVGRIYCQCDLKIGYGYTAGGGLAASGNWRQFW